MKRVHGIGRPPRSTLCAAAGGITLLAAVLVCWLSAPVAGAEVGASTPTVQATAADAAWLAYAPPPPTPGVVCLVDSGVDMNPDTESVVLGSHELSPDTGPGDEIAALSPPVDGHPDGHGTLMAMLISAPRNGWGMLGVAPQDRVYNMKALANGSTDFHDEVEAEAITACSQLREGPDPALSVVNLSLGGESVPDPAVATEAQDAILAARQEGIAVVAAAGNTGGALTFPASYSATIAVGAADAAASPGTLCSFSARAEKVVLAPGCDSVTGGIEGAWQDDGQPNVSQGTSQASAIYSAVLAALRAYAPTLTLNQAEACMLSSLNNGELDAAAAFDACGLGAIVQQGSQAEPKPPAAASGASGEPGTASAATGQTLAVSTHGCVGSCGAGTKGAGARVESFERSCARPAIAAARRVAGRVRLAVRSKVAGCLLQARIKSPHARRWTLIKWRRARALSFQASPAARIQVRFVSPAGLLAASAWVPVRLR